MLALRRFMFWTDWVSGNPSVNRANLDGSDPIKLFTKNKVEWPNGITIDYIARRIYWVDAREDYIASSDFFGNGFKKIIDQNVSRLLNLLKIVPPVVESTNLCVDSRKFRIHFQ